MRRTDPSFGEEVPQAWEFLSIGVAGIIRQRLFYFAEKVKWSKRMSASL
jgi:hypothetical protein